MVNAKGTLEQHFCTLFWVITYTQAVWEIVPGRLFAFSDGLIPLKELTIQRSKKPHEALKDKHFHRTDSHLKKIGWLRAS